MRILIAPNSFKHSLDAIAISDLIEKAFLSVNQRFKLIKKPVADGGDFSLEIISQNQDVQINSLQVTNPIGKKVPATYLMLDDSTAFIEMAKASGIQLLDDTDLNPYDASTFGTGEMIMDAIHNGARKILLGVGGSATVDIGAGALQKLGCQFMDYQENELKKINAILAHSSRINLESIKWIKDVEFEILCDVDNPILGEQCGIQVYGPQKGIPPEEMDFFLKRTRVFVSLLEEIFGHTLSNMPYTGAAGGIPASFKALFNTTLHNGAKRILEIIEFENAIQNCDLVITGEGKFDEQTLSGKAPMAVAHLAKKYNKPVCIIAGQVLRYDTDLFDGVFSILDKVDTLENMISRSEYLIYNTSRQLALIIDKMYTQHG